MEHSALLEHFGEVFFRSWRQAGLPDPQPYIAEYIHLRDHGTQQHEWLSDTSTISPGIDHVQLNSVYGFGRTTGNIFAELFGLNDSLSTTTGDWCGRFNLGISLFDHICDEMKCQSDVTSLQVFRPFIKTGHFNTYTLTAAETLLTRLAGTVLHDVTIADGKKSGALFTLMKQMYEAENFVSKTRLCDDVLLPTIEKALVRKSAEPFRVMAEFTVRMADATNLSMIKNARIIGKALGHCYWVIDDARDVWEDLRAGQWNLFLLIAAKNDSQIFTRKNEMFAESHVTGILQQPRISRKISNEITQKLVNAINLLDITEQTKQHTLGLVAASLWQWFHY